MCSTSSISHLTTKSSKTLETIAVREIGHILYVICLWVFLQFAPVLEREKPRWGVANYVYIYIYIYIYIYNVICTITISYKISFNASLF